MYSISEISKITNLTARTLRHYEDKGLISPSYRAQNGYRYFSDQDILKLNEIKKFKKMQFSLDEIRDFLNFTGSDLEIILKERLTRKMSSLENEMIRVAKCRDEVENQLMATDNFFEGKSLAKNQRRILMETIKQEVLDQLKKKKKVTHQDLEHLKREDYLFDSEDKRAFMNAVRDCLSYAKSEGVRLGPARGAAPALLSMYALGWSDFDPSEHNLIPERFSGTGFDLHIDVEFKNGKKFIDYCRRVSSKLNLGKIEAFRLPILDIIENVHNRLGREIDYDSIDDNDSLVLDLFRSGDIEHIFSFDIPKNTLLAKHFDSNYYKDGTATKLLSAYLKSQEVFDFKDLLNIESIFRPDNLDTKPFMREYIDRYPRAKKDGHSYPCLTSSLNEYLKPNFGVIIYQEDIIQIINEYTSWSYNKCNEFRRALSFHRITDDQQKEFLEYGTKDVLDLLIKESPVVFCKAHSMGAWPKLIKKTAILKTLHKDIYLEEIRKWESENAYSWGDFGFISGGISLLQQ